MVFRRIYEANGVTLTAEYNLTSWGKSLNSKVQQAKSVASEHILDTGSYYLDQAKAKIRSFYNSKTNAD